MAGSRAFLAFGLVFLVASTFFVQVQTQSYLVDGTGVVIAGDSYTIYINGTAITTIPGAIFAKAPGADTELLQEFLPKDDKSTAPSANELLGVFPNPLDITVGRKLLKDE